GSRRIYFLFDRRETEHLDLNREWPVVQFRKRISALLIGNDDVLLFTLCCRHRRAGNGNSAKDDLTVVLGQQQEDVKDSCHTALFLPQGSSFSQREKDATITLHVLVVDRPYSYESTGPFVSRRPQSASIFCRLLNAINHHHIHSPFGGFKLKA